MGGNHKKVLIQMRDLRVGNGIATCIMNYYEQTLEKGFYIDFLLNRDIESPFKDRVINQGGNIFVLPKDSSKPNIANRKYISQVVSDRYDILHVNITGLNALISLLFAKKAGIPQRIYHAHNPKETSSLVARIRSEIYENPCVFLANQYAACSKYAGDSLFGSRNYTVLKNAMDVSRFYYDESAREKLRRELNVENNFVVGVVARFAEQKNPFFTVDIFSELKKKIDKATLIWAGDGPLKEAVNKYISEQGLSESIRLIGLRTDVNKLYSAMDMFLLPSKFEGFGNVFLEAQISGLQCFGSDRIPVDVEVSSQMFRVSLDKKAFEWADYIIGKLEEKNRSEIIETGFDIANVSDDLAKMYSLKEDNTCKNC